MDILSRVTVVDLDHQDHQDVMVLKDLQEKQAYLDVLEKTEHQV